MLAKCKQHSSRLRASATSAVAAAEEACMAHIRSKGELSPTDDVLQEKVSKAAYAAAAVDGLTAQVHPSRHCLSPVLFLTLAVNSAVFCMGTFVWCIAHKLHWRVERVDNTGLHVANSGREAYRGDTCSVLAIYLRFAACCWQQT